VKVGDLIKPWGGEKKVGVVLEVYADPDGNGPISVCWFDDSGHTFTYSTFVEVLNEYR
tara:strand:+ start:1182 stop:1355 length:174 start_codon:yes stop_codon:yes gene_type:complete